MKHRVLALMLVLVMLTGMLVACDDGSETSSTTTQNNGPFIVAIDVGPHITVVGESQLTVASGARANFEIVLDPGYSLVEPEVGTYNADTGVFTIKGVKADMRVSLTAICTDGYDVTVSGDHVSVEGNATVKVPKGGTESFKIVPEEGYLVVGASHGTFNHETGVLTITNVQGNMNVTVTTVAASTTAMVNLQGTHFTSSSSTSLVVEKGQDATFPITLDRGYGIASIEGGELDENGNIVVRNVQESCQVKVVVSPKVIIYHHNDGTDETTEYYPDLTFWSAPNTKWDDDTFVRAGYVLIEYNTKADGTGEALSLGSKIHFDKYAAEEHLWCTWAKETPAASFTFASVKISGVNGYAITGYTGNDSTVVIPLTYNSKPVIQIKAGAFSDKTNMTTLVMPKNLRTVDGNAFTGCSALDTLYFSNSIKTIPNTAFDAATYSNLHHFYLNATQAPFMTRWFDGMYRTGLDAIVSAEEDEKLMVFLAASSGHYGFSSTYMKALFNDEYKVVNFSTVRTTAIRLYLEAFEGMLGEGDVLVYAPEPSSIYTMGSGKLDTFKIFRDTEGMINVFRHVDIANFSDYFAGITDYNTKYAGSATYSYEEYAVPELTGYSSHEVIINYPSNNPVYWTPTGDLIGGPAKNQTQNGTPGIKVYFTDSIYNEAGTVNAASIKSSAAKVKAAIAALRDNGVTVFFGFAPVNKNALAGTGATASTQTAYETMIAEQFGVELLGSCSDHIFEWNYFVSNDAHHLTDKGRVLHTWQMYLDLCEAMGITDGYTNSRAVGTDFEGCKW